MAFMIMEATELSLLGPDPHGTILVMSSGDFSVLHGSTYEVKRNCYIIIRNITITIHAAYPLGVCFSVVLCSISQVRAKDVEKKPQITVAQARQFSSLLHSSLRVSGCRDKPYRAGTQASSILFTSTTLSLSPRWASRTYYHLSLFQAVGKGKGQLWVHPASPRGTHLRRYTCHLHMPLTRTQPPSYKES